MEPKQNKGLLPPIPTKRGPNDLEIHGSQKIYPRLNEKLNLNQIWIPGNEGAVATPGHPFRSRERTSENAWKNDVFNGRGEWSETLPYSEAPSSIHHEVSLESGKLRVSLEAAVTLSHYKSGEICIRSLNESERREPDDQYGDLASVRPPKSSGKNAGKSNEGFSQPNRTASPPPYSSIFRSPPKRPPRDCDYGVDFHGIIGYPVVNRCEKPAHSRDFSYRSAVFSERKQWEPEEQRRLAKQRLEGMALFTNLHGSGNDVSTNPALMETVRLFKNSKERDWYENMSDLFAVVNSIEQLEKAYIRDCITPKEYTAACSKLLVQYKSAFKLITSDEFPTVAAFMQRFKFDCPAAMERIREDNPITIRDDKGNTSKCIADIVALFITVMDKLRLQMKAVDEIQPEMRDLMDTINRLSMLPADYEGRIAVHKWLQTMATMSASDQFDDNQIRQMLFDLEAGYSGFLKLLHSS